ncbi:MAG: FAD:protein FMN transferase, partial [Rikenellaceae bacterium]|nr:FAD:protein FMN transferase [Rikenellaceae bacterium]
MGPLNQIYKKLDAGGAIYYAWATAMHTRIDVVLCHRPQDECQAAAEALVAELGRLEARLNRFDPESDLTRINALAARQYIDLDPEMWGILASALNYGTKTDWFFDVTVQSTGRLAPPAGRVVMDMKKHAITFSGKGVVIDLGGFAKGYGLEKVQQQL